MQSNEELGKDRERRGVCVWVRVCGKGLELDLGGEITSSSVSLATSCG